MIDGKRTPVSKIAITPFIVSAFFAIIAVAAVVFWNFRRSDKPTLPITGWCHEIIPSNVLR